MSTVIDVPENAVPRQPWNKGRLVGRKRPLKPKDVWAIRVRLEISGSKRELALFNLAIDSKLRACDLVRLKVEDVQSGGRIRERGDRSAEDEHAGPKSRRPRQHERQSRIGSWPPGDVREDRKLGAVQLLLGTRSWRDRALPRHWGSTTR